MRTYNTRMHLYVGLLTISMALCCVACNKKEEDPVLPAYIHLENPFREKLFLNLYATEEDYYNNGKAFKLVLEPLTVLDIAAPIIGEKEYHADWYTQDFAYSNWNHQGDLKVSARNGILEFVKNDTASYRGYERKIWISGNKTFSEWKAVDAYAVLPGRDYYPVWTLLNNTQRSVGIRFGKDMKGIHSYKDVFGNNVSQPIHYILMQNGEQLQAASNNQEGPHATFSTHFSLRKPAHFDASSDTMSARFTNDSAIVYLMIKQ